MARRRDIEWAKALDYDLALKNVQTDIIGDWYRDPWGWPELKWVVKSSPSTLESRLNSEGTRLCSPIDVPKENFHFRPALVIDPIDRLCYQAIVDRLSIKLIGSLPDLVYGWRLPPNKPQLGVYARNNNQWKFFRSKLTRLSTTHTYGLKTDIVSYFASINIDNMETSIRSKTSKDAITDRLIDLIISWNEISTRSGIPQRSLASSVLANMYLKPIDDILNQHSACRWMDDIWLFGNDDGFLRKTQIELQQCLSALGLYMNSAKTDLLESQYLIYSIQNMEHSGVDQGMSNNNPSQLLDLIDKILEHPEQTDRTTIRFATHRMYKYNYYDPIPRLIGIAHKMPQGADYLARLFRRSNIYRELSEWYIQYSNSHWAIEWPIAQLGTMFPSDSPNSKLIDHFGELLSGQVRISLPLTSLVASRLAKWDKSVARSAIREAQSRADHPLQRRALALAAITAEEEQHIVRQALQEFEENKVILDMLDQTRWRPPQLTKDFG